jgi:predicted metal-dependent hydrolase
MNTSTHQISVSGIGIEIVRKSAVKNLHLGVYPPHGQVRVTAPTHITDEAIRLAAIAKLTWIKQQQSKFQAQPRQSKREMVSGESHYFLGDRYLLDVIEHQGKSHITLKDRTHITLYIKPETTTEQRSQLMQEWYRSQLKSLIPSQLDKWTAIVGVELPEWNIKKMKTKWGSCNIEARRIWLNLELAKKPIQCLEYVIVHELIHLLERNHSDRFKALMDRAMPQWRLFRDELNQLPLGHDSWS